MELLIVDDEESAILAVIQGVHWERLEFSGVYTATNIVEAREKMNKHDIRVLLCDIEMPMGSGLELLEWVNEHRPGICCIFMTCHAEFSFAQQALHLGSFEYILKPLNFESLEKVLANAILKVHQDTHMKTASDYWETGHKAAKKQFWRELFNGDIDANDETIRNYIQRNQLDIPPDGRFVAVLVCPRLLSENMPPEDKPLYNFSMRNVLEEVFRMKAARQELETLSDDKILVMLLADEGVTDTVLFEQIRQCCRTLTEVAQRYLKAKMSCYVGDKVSIGEIPGQIELLYRMDFNNVVAPEIVICLREFRNFMESFAYAEYISTRYDKYQGSYAKIIEEIGRVLDRSRYEIVLDAVFKKQFFQGFYYMLSEFSAQHNVFVRDLVAAKPNRDLLIKAEDSVDALVEWVKYIGDILLRFEMNDRGRQTPVDQVRTYIKQHIDEELPVDKLAAQVHLNSDYLNRIFKKETGLTVSKYTIMEKMERAKWLLRHTDWPINEVAAAVGYYNYSSFNRSFTKLTGQSPQEWKLKKQG